MSDDILVSIVGGGLSAIYSFFGAINAGYAPSQIEVFTPGNSLNYGAVFMYESPIPWNPKQVTSILLGTCRGYAKVQWGDDSIQTSAHARFNGGLEILVQEDLYDPEELMPILWSIIPNLISTDHMQMDQVRALSKVRDAVICTFPDYEEKHKYTMNGFLTSFPVYADSMPTDSYYVLYNGLEDVPWVRKTVKPGICYTEYPLGTSFQRIKELESKHGSGYGDIRNAPNLNPNCKPIEWEDRIKDNILRVGRFAVFDPSYLSHQAMYDTTKFLLELGS